MKELPKVSKISLDEFENKKRIRSAMAGIVVGFLAGTSVTAAASTDTAPLNKSAQENVARSNVNPQTGVAVILARPSLDGQVFAAHYSHSSHASHASHYSCTPGSTC